MEIEHIKITDLKQAEYNPRRISDEDYQKLKNSISKSKSTNKTSNYYRVYKVQDPRYKQGFRYVYSYINENGNRKTISSVNINKLKQKVKKSNLLWIKF